VSYNNCTTVESSNGAAWCATEVDSEGTVLENKWQDCDEGCPGTDFTCNDGFLFNVEGTCVNGSEAGSRLRSIQRSNLVASLDDIPSESSQKPAPFCDDSRSTADVKCRCTKEATLRGVDGNPHGGCVPPRDDVGISDLEFGWCFLENIVDPENPTTDCYDDVQWSEVDGRFWSNVACFEEKRRPQVCLSTLNNPCKFPFTYKNVTHTECTHVGSENGAAWCATQVDENGIVVTNKWEDCQAGCPTE